MTEAPRSCPDNTALRQVLEQARDFIDPDRDPPRINNRKLVMKINAVLSRVDAQERAERTHMREIDKPSMSWGNFHKIVFYGNAWMPSYSYWIVPGTITNEERM